MILTNVEKQLGNSESLEFNDANTSPIELIDTVLCSSGSNISEWQFGATHRLRMLCVPCFKTYLSERFEPNEHNTASMNLPCYDLLSIQLPTIQPSDSFRPRPVLILTVNMRVWCM